jgi:phosphoribosylaminoimidazolecarboxamide formyltransferase / IMP cyclohydrolase
LKDSFLCSHSKQTVSGKKILFPENEAFLFSMRNDNFETSVHCPARNAKSCSMENQTRIKSALISVYYKDQLEKVVQLLHQLGVSLISTGGTMSFIETLDIPVTPVESLTAYPSIFGGRVKTLHPRIFGGILARGANSEDEIQLSQYNIPKIDLVIVDLYPFEETLRSGASDDDIIEKIDIGGISLIRAAAKNYRDVLVVSSRGQYDSLLKLLEKGQGVTSLEERRLFARDAFEVSSHYDMLIYNYFSRHDVPPVFKESKGPVKTLRYGENPHQKGFYYGELGELFEQLHGKEISYNNMLDLDAAIRLADEFQEPTIAILKHNNPCGLASREKLADAWRDALAGDPVSAFGGVIVLNRPLDLETAREMDKLFFEIVIAPDYDGESLSILRSRKNRIILKRKSDTIPAGSFRSVLNGVLIQDADRASESRKDMRVVTEKAPTDPEYKDLEFANKIVKHCKSNAIVLAKNKQLLAAGVGQTSRVDALKHAIDKARSFDFDLGKSVMASDAFFPFADSVGIAAEAGVASVIQPGGSVRDQESIDLCNSKKISMVFTNIRHFKH